MKPPFLTCLLLAALVPVLPAAEDAPRPNVVFIMIDDLGWADVGCYGNDFVDTPHVDALAGEGMRFTDFYAAGAVCSPTRCAVQSGQNQARIGITAHIPGHWRPFERVITPQTTMALPLETVTVAESLQEAGYRTGYIGKWHLGNLDLFGPERQGYEFSAVVGGPHLPGRFRVRGGTNVDLEPGPDQYRTEFEAELANEFIEKHRDEPFFLMVSPFAVHIPLAALSEKVEKYRERASETGQRLPDPVYAAMIEHVDDMVGRIVASVESHGLTERTMIVFTSDNGGLYRRYDYNPEADDTVTSNAPLRGEKGQLYEGGIRVPLIVKYPPMIEPGSTSSAVTISHDFHPTFVDLAGGELPANQPIDGESFAPVLEDVDASLERSAVHFHYPHYHHDRPASAIREGPWKLIEYLDDTDEVELYHLGNDIGEETDLSSEKQGRVADLRRKLNIWRRETLARMPLANPNHDPERAPEWWSRRSGEPIDSLSRKPFPPTEKDL